MNRFHVPLDADERAALYTLAHLRMRDAKVEARRILRWYLRKRGLLQDDKASEKTTGQSVVVSQATTL